MATLLQKKKKTGGAYVLLLKKVSRNLKAVTVQGMYKWS